nr:DEAD/DEAH box helicase [Hasllibacter sp. MH4015]
MPKSDTPVIPALQKALDARGYDSLTPVQAAVTEPALEGRDLLVSAQTGSGKTLGFGLAIAPGLLAGADRFEDAGAPLALVIAPTRELAMQVKRELSWLFEHAGATLASTVGGMDMRDERRALARGAHIVVATPGRLRDHIMRGSIDLGAIRAVVLDEADEMLDLGFREDLEFILDASPNDRQTLLFSATVPAAIAKLAQNYQKNAERIATVTGAAQHADIEYRALNVAARDGENAVINLLRYYEAPNAIVFCNTRATVNRMTTRLSNRGFSVVALSGELSQSERTHALQAMRDGRARVCVATDVAARGIDLPNLELVIHAELPTGSDTLLHRSGRTGRAGRKGVSALIVPPAARKKAQRLLGWAKLTASWGDAPSADDVRAKDNARMLEETDWSVLDDGPDRAAMEALTEAHSAEELASAFVRLYRERHSAPEELSDASAPAPAKERAPFGPSVWFSLDGGRAAHAEPRRLLPMICKIGNITRDDVGAIRIQPEASLIEIRESAVAGFLASVGSDMVLENGARLVRLDKAPNLERAPRPPRHDTPRPPRPDTPKGDAPKPRGKAPGTTTPVDWNDAPEPRRKKPKPGVKPKGEKPKTRAEDKDRAGTKQGEPYKPRKPRHKAGDTSANRGPAPPKGKPNSKKNKARAAAKAAETGTKPRKPRAPKKPKSRGGA